MKTLFKETDPLTGITTEYGINSDQQLVERTIAQRDTKQIDYAKALANDDDYSKRGIKESYWQVGYIPPEVCVKWLGEGFNPYTAHPSEIIARLRKPEYAHLRTTHRKF